MPLYCQFDYRSSCRTFTFPFLVSDSVFLVLFRHRRGRKTKTSSDASDEAPERARNDAPKEVKLHEGSILFSRHSGEVSQASIRRFPWPQGRRSRGDRPTVRSRGTRDPTRGRDKRDHPCAGNLSAAAIRGTPLFALAKIVYQKSGLRTGRFDKIRTDLSSTKPLARRPARALSAGCLPSGTVIYERVCEI
jgi:hypothetical protein